jgi:diguanylate cyclase (GGDEF)-like protein
MWESPPLRRMPHGWQAGLLAVVYFVTAKASLVLAIPPGYATAVWPPSGIALAAMLLLGSRVWPGIWLGAVLANYTVSSSLALAVMMGTGNTLEALAGAALMRRYVGVPRRFERARDVVVFVAVAAASCTIAATIAALSMTVMGLLSWPQFLPNWWTWWQGDVAGIIIVMPLILSWRLRRAARWSHQKKLEAACLGLVLLSVSVVVFSNGADVISSLQQPFAILPFMIWAALRFSQRVVTTATAGVCAIAASCTANGIGPFAILPVNESLLVLLAFISTIVVTSLVLSAVTIDRRQAMIGLAQALAGLREDALTDPLTGLYNRRYLWQFLRKEWVGAKHRRQQLTVIMLDLDHFKRINDTFGHDTGDQVLAAVAGLLRNQIRSSDIVCRYGGEEFALVLAASSESVRQRAEAIRSAVKELDLREYGVPLGSVTASLGIAQFPEHAAGPDALMTAADAALYVAKSSGRDRAVFSPPVSGLPRPETEIVPS